MSPRCAADFDLVARSGDRLRFGARPADNDLCTADKRPTALRPMILHPVRWVSVRWVSVR